MFLALLPLAYVLPDMEVVLISRGTNLFFNEFKQPTLQKKP